MSAKSKKRADQTIRRGFCLFGGREAGLLPAQSCHWPARLSLRCSFPEPDIGCIVQHYPWLKVGSADRAAIATLLFGFGFGFPADQNLHSTTFVAMLAA